MSSVVDRHERPFALPGRRPAVQAALTEYVRRAATEHGDAVLSITLYGSQARGDADEESDIDLLVVVRQRTPALEERLSRLMGGLQDEHGVVISALVFAEAEWRARQAQRFPFYQNVEEDGIVLYQGARASHSAIAREEPLMRAGGRQTKGRGVREGGGSPVDEPIRDYARFELGRAREELEAAGKLIADGHWRIAISRAYYAMFYITTAALFSLGVRRSKHSGVEAALSQYLVQPGHLELEYKDIYVDARRRREDADYASQFMSDEAGARQALADAARFVARLERFLREAGAL